MAELTLGKDEKGSAMAADTVGTKNKSRYYPSPYRIHGQTVSDLPASALPMTITSGQPMSTPTLVMTGNTMMAATV